MLSHVDEVSKAPLPDQAEVDTQRNNVAKQQQKVDQLSVSHPSANGSEVCIYGLSVEYLSSVRLFGLVWQNICYAICSDMCQANLFEAPFHSECG